MKETRPLWPPQRGVGLKEPNLGKTNPVSHTSLFAYDLFCALSRGLVYISNANPACSCVCICKFQFRPIHPPSRRLSRCCRVVGGFLVNGGRSAREGRTVRAWCRLSRRFLVKAGRSARRGRTVRAWCRLSRRFLVKDGRSARRGRTVRAWCRLSSLAGRAICHTCKVLRRCCLIFYFCGCLFFPQRPLVSISFAVAGIVDVCH